MINDFSRRRRASRYAAITGTLITERLINRACTLYARPLCCTTFKSYSTCNLCCDDYTVLYVGQRSDNLLFRGNGWPRMGSNSYHTASDGITYPVDKKAIGVGVCGARTRNQVNWLYNLLLHCVTISILAHKRGLTRYLNYVSLLSWTNIILYPI